jgi:hypothetical protein
MGNWLGEWCKTLGVATPRKLAMVTLVLYGCLILIKLSLHGGDVTIFITAGDFFTDTRELLAPVTVLTDSVGYDGQFYYRLALNPLTSQARDFGITLDNPPFRMQRIVYPFLVWMASCGQPALVPWMMVLVNLIGMGFIAYLAAIIVQHLGASAWMAALVIAYPGFFVALNRDTTEIVATVFGITALLSALNRSAWKAVVFASIAVLARETTLLYLLGFGIMALAIAWKDKRYLSTDWVIYSVPAVVFIGWQLYLAYHWGKAPHSGGVQDLGWPMLGLGQLVFNNLTGKIVYSPSFVMDLALRGYTVSAALLCVYIACLVIDSLSNQNNPISLRLSWAAYAILMAFLSNVIWLTPGEYLRAFTECYVIGALLLIGARGPNMRRASIAVGIIWVPTLMVFIR